MSQTPALKFPGGATAFGSHYHSQWDSCQRKHWLARHAPHPTIEGATGLKANWTAEPLLIGDGFHIGMATYYLSGFSDGKYNIEMATSTAETAMRSREREWASPEAFSEAVSKVRSLLWGYDDFYGPGSKAPDFPALQIYCDAEGPIIEREYTIEVAGGHKFTCRVDALVKFQGWLWVLEHKTTAASSVGSLQTSMRTAIQGTGECYVLSKVFPDLPIQGVLLNVAVKNRGAKSKEPAYFRDPIARTAGQLEQFEFDLQNRYNAIRAAGERYERWLLETGDPWAAARRSYLASGASTGQCMAYNRACDFLTLCAGSGDEAMFASGFAAAKVPGSPEGAEEIAALSE